MLPVFLIAVLASFLQFTAVTYARIGPAALNLPLIVLVFFGLKRGFKIGTALGLFFGCYSGIFSTLLFWPHVILYTAVGFIIGCIGRLFYRDSLFVFILALFCSLAFIYSFNLRANFFSVFPPAAAYNIVISIFLFYFLRALKV